MAGYPIQNISLVEVMRLALLRAQDIAGKQQTESRITETGRSETTTPAESKFDAEIGAALKPLKGTEAGEKLIEGVWELVWEVESTAGTSKPLGDVLADLESKLLPIAYAVDDYLGVARGNDNSTTIRYYEERDRTELSKKVVEAEPSPSPPPANPPADPNKPTYKLYPMLQIAAVAGHNEGLERKRVSRSTPSSLILEESGLLEHIEKIQNHHPGVNGSLLKQTCESVIERAQSAGWKRKDFFVDLALTEKEIGQLERNTFSFQSAFPDIANELGHLSNALAAKERGHKAAMSPLEGNNPLVYASPAERDQVLEQNRAAGEAARRPADTPAPPVSSTPPASPIPAGRAEPESTPEQPAEERDSEKQDSGKWVRRTAAATAATAAVASIGAGIKGHVDGQKQNPDGSQQDKPRSRFGTGAKIAVGAALAITALVIAKPELVGLGGNAGRSR